MVADEPTAEPLADLRAQIADLRDPNTRRKAVYLSKANVTALGPKGVSDLARGFPKLANFDRKGGTLIVPVIGPALALRAKEPDMQRVLGALTGAGDGKREDQTVVVQGRTIDGAVASEGAVAPGDVEDKLRAVEADGKIPVVTTVGEALQRRAGLVSDAIPLYKEAE